VGELVLDLHALSETFASGRRGNQLAESMLELFVVGDGDGATGDAAPAPPWLGS
jgi:hypothetical protein